MAEAYFKTEKKDPFARSKNCLPVKNQENMVIISGSSNPELGKSIAKYLNKPLCDHKVLKFADCEFHIDVNESVIGKHIYIVQSTSRPVNESIMELILTISACKRAGAATISCVIPYYGYARQERKNRNRAQPISSSDVSQILEFMGANKIITLDVHAPAVTGSVSPKTVFEDYEAAFTAIDYFKKEIPGDKSNLCIVAPDAGAVKRTKSFHENFEKQGFEGKIGLAMMHKERKKANEVASTTVLGDVKGKTCIIIDDMTDTSGTLCKAAIELKEQGATKVYAFITHGIFSGPAADRIRESQIEKVVCTDSMKQDPGVLERMGGKLEYVSVDLLLAEIIRRSHEGESAEELFDGPAYKS